MEKIAIFAIQIAKQSYLNMEISAKYSPDEIEARWYQYWLDKGLFKSKPDGRKPFTIVIPPPNVTGVLLYGMGLTRTAG